MTDIGADTVRRGVEALLGPERSAGSVGLVYGSFAHGHANPRDLDILVIRPAGTTPEYWSARIAEVPASICSIPLDRVLEDIDGDRQGWGTMSKFLFPVEHLFGPPGLTEDLIASSYHRILGATFGTNPFDRGEAPERLRATMRAARAARPMAWIDQPDLVRYLDARAGAALDQLLLDGHCALCDDQRLVLRPHRRTAPANLAALALAEWSYYLSAKMDPRRFLDPVVDDLLVRKSVLPPSGR